VRNGHAECLATLEEVRRENKGLTDDIRDIMDQISEGGRNIHEIEKVGHTEIRCRIARSCFRFIGWPLFGVFYL
jgi:hypothetical protein